MYQRKSEKDIRCPPEYGMALFGGKWNSRIICVLAASGALRYSELRREMRIYLAALLIYSVQVACQYSFVALDQAPKAIFLTVWRKIILLIPLIFLMPHLWSDAAAGVYLTEPIADTIAVCTTAPMFYAYYRKLK